MALVTRSMAPDLWKCENPTCPNLISNVGTKNQRKRFCSDYCRNKIYYEKKGRRHEKVVLEPRPCEYCNKIFKPKRASTARFCSKSCNWRDLHKVKLCVSCVLCGAPIKPFGKKIHCTRRCAILNSMLRTLKKYGVVK